MMKTPSVTEFCDWVRGRFGSDRARVYIRPDIGENRNKLRDRMVDEHFAVWAEFIVHYTKEVP